MNFFISSPFYSFPSPLPMGQGTVGEAGGFWGVSLINGKYH